MIIVLISILIEWLIIGAMLFIHYHKYSKERRKMLNSIKVLMTKKKLSEAHTNVRISGDTMLLKKLYFVAEFVDTSPKLIWAFDPQEVIRIGRGRENQIQMLNMTVSRVHGQIFEYEGGIYIQNIGTKNVISVKQRGMISHHQIYAGQWMMLRDKDTIILGEHRIRVHIFNGADIYKYR